MDTDGGGSIGFMELMMAMEIVGSTKWDIFMESLDFIFIRDTFDFRFNDEVSWAFRIFDIDNSGSIAVEEINDSVEVSDSMELRWIILRESLKHKPVAPPIRYNWDFSCHFWPKKSRIFKAKNTGPQSFT